MYYKTYVRIPMQITNIEYYARLSSTKYKNIYFYHFWVTSDVILRDPFHFCATIWASEYNDAILVLDPFPCSFRANFEEKAAQRTKSF